MRIDLRIPLMMPKSIRHASSRSKKAWEKRAIIWEFFKLRRKLINDTGEDIFGVYHMDDSIELNIHADFETIQAE